eukprot:06157.XXX_134770_134656_1 [CDS] Oithona nana genome sequencing.
MNDMHNEVITALSINSSRFKPQKTVKSWMQSSY